MLNHILHLFQQHGFVVEESGCWTDLPAVQTFHQLIAEQLESSIRQEWNNIPLPKVQQLVSSVPDVVKRRGDATQHGPVPAFRDVLLPWKFTLSLYFSRKKINCFTFSIWYVFYVLLWIKCLFMKCANHFILFLFTFYTASQPFWNWVATNYHYIN